MKNNKKHTKKKEVERDPVFEIGNKDPKCIIRLDSQIV
jgi:hypothetical protein